MLKGLGELKSPFTLPSLTLGKETSKAVEKGKSPGLQFDPLCKSEFPHREFVILDCRAVFFPRVVKIVCVSFAVRHGA